MKRSTVRFEQLKSMLEEMGFHAHRKERGWLFEHAVSGAEFIFTPYRPHDRVYEHHLVAVRSALDWHGLMTPDAFDHLLTKTPA